MSLTVNVQAALLGVAALLAASTAGVWALVRLAPGGDFTELTLRTRSWWMMISAVALAVMLGPRVTFGVLALVGFLALKEYLSVVPLRWCDRPVVLLAYASIPLQTALVALGQERAALVFAPLFAFIVIPVAMVAVGETRGFLRSAATVAFGILVAVYGFGHLSFLIALPDGINPAGGSLGLVIYLVFLAQFNDVLQYVAGKLAGRRPAVPAISPGKTWEGLLGGLVPTAVLSVFLAGWLTPLGRVEALAFGILIPLGGFLGDVVLSAVKRDLGIKDMSQFIAGHGGVLDRIDSLVFTAPLFFHYLNLRYG